MKENTGGFTLLEVLISLAIFAVSMLGVQSMLVYRYTSDNFSKKMAIADNVATELMEQVRSAPYYKAGGVTATNCTLAADTSIVDCLRPDNADGSKLAAPYSSFINETAFSLVNGVYVQRLVNITANSPAAEMKQIIVTVRWKMQQSDTTYKTIEYATIRDRGIK